MLLKNEFVACDLVFGFKQPDVEFLNKLTGNPLDRFQKHLALVKDHMTPVFRKAHKSLEGTGKVIADLGLKATIEIMPVIREDLLADAREIEKNYSAFYETCREIIDTKQEEASPSLNP